MRLAAIDLGSNTVRLLVAEVEAGGWRVLDQDQRVTRLGEGLAGTGRLGPEPWRRTAATVGEYVRRAAGWSVDGVRIVATSAVREAANGGEFAAEVGGAVGHPVVIVSGEDEARLTLRGVLQGLGDAGDTLLSVDIGGGSTEFVLARGGRLVQAVSLRLGVVPLAERFPFPGPVDWTRYQAMEAEITGHLERALPPAMAAAAPLVGTAGTVTTLAALDLGLALYDPGRVQGHRLTRARLDGLRRRLGALGVAARAALPCLEPGRADLILPGLAIVTATMRRVGAATLVVSDWGLREGIVAEAVEARP